MPAWTLHALARQAGVAPDAEAARPVALMGPQALYELWERQPWSAHAIDLRHDAEQWASLPAYEREAIGWTMSTFLVAEERVTSELAGLMRAHESRAEEAFLATQQVDEARHVQHFARFAQQVVGFDGTFDETIERARDVLTPAFTALFEERLAAAHEQLLADPGDLGAKVEFVTTYHMVIEGTIALAGQRFLIDHFEDREILAGCTRGLRNIAQDEHRHVAYGTWYLCEKLAHPPLAARMQACVRELIPLASEVLTPPVDQLRAFRRLGYVGDETHRFAFRALSRRLAILGVSVSLA